MNIPPPELGRLYRKLATLKDVPKQRRDFDLAVSLRRHG